VLTRRIKIQLAVFAAVSLTAAAFMVFAYMQAPAVFFGVDRYTVTVQLPQAGGLYPSGNVTYRGVEVGRVEEVRLTDTGAEAVLQLESGTRIPADLDAQGSGQESRHELEPARVDAHRDKRAVEQEDDALEHMKDGAYAADPDGESAEQEPEACHVDQRQQRRDDYVDPVAEADAEGDDQAAADDGR